MNSIRTVVWAALHNLKTFLKQKIAFLSLVKFILPKQKEDKCRIRKKCEACLIKLQIIYIIFFTYRPRLLLAGSIDNGQTSYIAPSLLYSMEHLSTHLIDLPALFGTSTRTPEEAIAQVFLFVSSSFSILSVNGHLRKFFI